MVKSVYRSTCNRIRDDIVNGTHPFRLLLTSKHRRRNGKGAIMRFGRATPNDTEMLTRLAFNAKGYWGYTKDFLAQLKDDLTVTDEDVLSKRVYLLEEQQVTRGFYILNTDDKKLEALFVDPTSIGKGYETAL